MGDNIWICKKCGPNVTCTCGLGLVPVPYKHPSPELMKLLEQLANDRAMYGSAFWTIDPDGSKRRVDPSTVRVVDDLSCTATPEQSWQWLFDNMPERLRGIDDAALGSRLVHILSRTHETDKPGVTDMPKVDFHTGPLCGRFRAPFGMQNVYGSHPIGGGPRASCHCPAEPGEDCPLTEDACKARTAETSPAPTQLTTVTNMETGVIRMTETDVFADGAALTTAIDGRFVPLPDGRTRDMHGMSGAIALTSASHPPGSLLAAELAAESEEMEERRLSGCPDPSDTAAVQDGRCITRAEMYLGEGEAAELRPANDAALGSLHWVEAEFRQATPDGDVPAVRCAPLRAVWRWCGDLWRHDGGDAAPFGAYLAGWRYLGPAEYVAPDTFGRDLRALRMLIDGERQVTKNASDSDSLNTSWNVPISAMTRFDPALYAGNTRLGLAASFGKASVTPEMKWVGFQAGLELQPRAPLQGETVEAIYRAMHAAAPVPLVSEAEDRVAELELAPDKQRRIARLWEVQSRDFLGRIEEQRSEIVALTKERDAAQRNFDTLCRVNDSLRARLTTEQPTDIDYNGPVKDGRAIPDPSHEQFHRSIGDVLAGKIIPAARRQMEDALGRAPKEPITAPDAILRGNKAPVGIVERQA